ncbi:MAG: precorrin-8X methylmutase [Lachnospiraceae bacterium]|nr:precorrin-8X methylmutase [Lachnospiraceae bacterium]
MKIETVRPDEIEKRSFEIITSELEQAGITLDEETAFITKRCIHTSADPEYASTLVFSEGAVGIMKEMIRGGACIVTDTNMALSGINKKKLAAFGGEAMCFMADDDVIVEAAQRGITRAAVSMERAAGLERDIIFAIGNAPTALIRLYEMMEEKIFIPKFVIGVPVGFVNVTAAKELFIGSDVPYIINLGRKGGSSIAAAICNAVLYDLQAPQEFHKTESRE